jgi:hypothetical protein
VDILVLVVPPDVLVPALSDPLELVLVLKESPVLSAPLLSVALNDPPELISIPAPVQERVSAQHTFMDVRIALMDLKACLPEEILPASRMRAPAIAGRQSGVN